MKKTISKIILTTIFAQQAINSFIGTGVLKAYAAQVKSEPVIIAINNADHQDLRVQALEHVFQKHNSPLTDYSKAYIKIADKYGVDWKLLPAISGLESSFGNAQMPGSYNSYGWGGGLIYFNSVEDGIDTVIRGLKYNYIDRGATTIDTIAPIYSESKTWAPRIKMFVREIDLEYSKLKADRLTLTI